MISITRKEDCCGCGACRQRCPKQCISLVGDGEGFWYPQVDEEACVGCGVCEAVCPMLTPREETLPMHIVAAKNRNEEERMDSSSGGAFIVVARTVISQGGVVFGAVFDEHWAVCHIHTESMDGVRRMMGSKYSQSRMGDAYREAEQFLRQGRRVLFTGTPCQVAGLHSFLRGKDYPNLLTLDILCHGVPSPGVWRRYLSETFAPESGSTHSAQPAIAGIRFRDKKVSGWKKYRLEIDGEPAEGQAEQSADGLSERPLLLSDVYWYNPFMRGFLTNIYLRPSCHECRFRNGASQSDITVGDFWGARVVEQDMDDDKGISLILFNTPKGKAFAPLPGMESRELTIEKAHLRNGAFERRTPPHAKRALFFRLLGEKYTVAQAVATCIKEPAYKQLTKKIRQKLRKIINALNIIKASSTN